MSDSLNVSVGTTHPKGTMMLIVQIGEAALPDTSEHGEQRFVFGLANNKTPVVLSLTSNQYYTLSWEEILTLAIDNGVLGGAA